MAIDKTELEDTRALNTKHDECCCLNENGHLVLKENFRYGILSNEYAFGNDSYDKYIKYEIDMNQASNPFCREPACQTGSIE
jgi:hypothetical protein